MVRVFLRRLNGSSYEVTVFFVVCSLRLSNDMRNTAILNFCAKWYLFPTYIATKEKVSKIASIDRLTALTYTRKTNVGQHHQRAS